MKMLFTKTIAIITFILIYATFTIAQNGGYVVFLNGKKAMTDDFVLEKTGDGSLKLTSNVNGAKIVTIAKPNKPQSFTLEQQNTKAISVDFQNGSAKVFMLGKSELTVPSKANVILENNVWSQYILLLEGYDSAKSGKQEFRFFLPSLALEFPLSLQKINSRTILLNGKNIVVDDYEIVSEAANFKVKITADTNKIPLLIEIPAQQVKVVNKDFEAEADKLSVAAKKVFNFEFTSEEVSFPNDKITLSGTLTVPKNEKKTFPVVILISGSGGQDRDGSETSNLYKIIAESLSKAGVAVLRVDDRGIGKSVISKEQAATTSYFDLISDTRAAIDFLSKRPEIDQTKITLIGHSEGVGTALYLASEDKRVTAIALLAGASNPLDKVVIEQALYQMAKGETVDVANRKQSQIVQFLMKMFADAKLAENANNPKFAYFREHANFNPLALTEKVKCPVLIMQGERDSQVLAYHAVNLASSLVQSGNKNVSLRILPNLGHLFNSSEDSNISQEMIYDLQIWAEMVFKP